MILQINPVAKPRMTRSDKWKKRPAVLKYRAFADELRLKVPGDIDMNNKVLIFGVPMPKSWTKKKRAAYKGQPHQQTPDLDNFIKATLDALYSDDSGIWAISAMKVWSDVGYMEIIDESA
jgi:Holliday junction resolvase RusA-like endonuclease